MTLTSRALQAAKPEGTVRGAPSAIKKAQNTRSYNYLVNEIQTVKKLQSHYKPETKVFQTATSAAVVTNQTGAVNLFSQISQGLNNDERVGSKIRVKRVEISCSVGDDTFIRNQNFYLIRPHENDNPIVGDFSGGIYPVYDTTSGWEVWRYHCNMHDTPIAGTEVVKTFGHGGMLVTFEAGSANPTRNPLFWVTFNRDTSSRSYYLTYRIWYTDA